MQVIVLILTQGSGCRAVRLEKVTETRIYDSGQREFSIEISGTLQQNVQSAYKAQTDLVINIINKSMSWHKRVHMGRLPKPELYNENLERDLPLQPFERVQNSLKGNQSAMNGGQTVGGETFEGKPLGELQVRINSIFDENLKHVKQKAKSIFSTTKTFFPISKPKGKENISKKALDIFKQQACRVANYSLRAKPLAQRPSTPEPKSRYIDENINTKPHSATTVLFQMRSSTPVNGDRISTSRALMNYSKVHRRENSNQFVVKKDRSLMSRIGQVSAQKVKFQEKEKPERKEVKTEGSTRKRYNQSRLSKVSQNEEDFELVGWEQFDP